MDFIRVSKEGFQTLVNLDFVTKVVLNEAEQKLEIHLKDNTGLDLRGEEALRIWRLIKGEFELRDETEADDYADNADSGEYVYGSDLKLEIQDLSEITNRVADLERRLEEKQVYNHFEGSSLLFELERMRVPKANKAAFQALLSRTKKIADEVQNVVEINQIERSLTMTYTTILSARKVVNELDMAARILKSKGKLLPELETKIRRGKERAALFRAIKKLKEAEVVAKDNQPKYDKLIEEADVLLKQDWADFFPGETPPELSSVQKM